MQKISRIDAKNNPYFLFGDNFLKENVTKIAALWEGKASTVEEKANAHFRMVAQIVKMYLLIMSSLDEETLKQLNNQKGNLIVLNRLLALRQLAETQLTGLTQGTWGIPPDIISSDEFQEAVAASSIELTKEEVINASKQ